MTNALTLGPWLKQRRRQLALTQTAVAQRAACSLSTLRKLEAGELLPSKELARSLADALGVATTEEAAFIAFARDAQSTAEPGAFLEQPLQPPPLPPRTVPPAVVPSAPPASTGRSAPAAMSPARLPTPMTSLVGRDAALATGAALLHDPTVRLLTLTGAPGTGKTRLGLALATALQTSFRDGVYFVPLATLSTPALLAESLLNALSIMTNSQLPALTMLQAFLADKELLLLLDNFEQIVTAAPLLIELLQHAPGVKLLVTSRTLLRVYGEYEYVVPPLAVPDPAVTSTVATVIVYPAVELFVQRAQAVQANFAVTPANVAAVAQICAMLDGLPLAIEMAAARCKLYPPAILLKQLQQRLTGLSSQARNLPPRQQTLQAAIDWSYQMLQPAEQQLFRLLGLFVGGCTVATAVALWPAAAVPMPALLDSTVEALLQALVEQSMVQVTPPEEADARYTTLVTLRDYAAERLIERGEHETAQQRFVAYFLALAQQADAGLTGGETKRWLRWLTAEHNNLRAILQAFIDKQQVDSDQALQLVEALSRFWFRTGQWREGRRWLEAALEHDTGARPLTRARVLRNLARLLMNQGESAASLQYASECLPLFRALADQAGLADVLFILGYNANQRQAWVEAQHYLEESSALWSALGDKRALRNVLGLLGAVAANQGQIDQGTTYYTTCLTLAQQANDHAGCATAYSGLGDLARLREDYKEAERCFTASLEHTHQSGGSAMIPVSLHNLGQAHLSQGALDRAIRCFQEALQLAKSQDNRRVILACLAGLGQVAHAQGQWQIAARLSSAVTQGLTAAQLQFERTDQLAFARLAHSLQAQSAVAPFAGGPGSGEALTQAAAIALAQTITVDE